MKPNSSKIAHFPIKNYYNLHFTTTPQNQFYPTIPHTYFSTEFRTTFNFIEVLTDDKPDSWATIIQNSTNHIATLPTELIGYIEVPITNEKPKFYQVNEFNTLIHNVTPTNHPEITELIPQTNYSLQYAVDTVLFHQFSLHQKYMTNSDTPPITSSRYNLQPTSHTSKPPIFPSVPYILSPFIISNTNRHVQYRGLTSFNKNDFELINFDYSSIVEHSEKSDSKPYTNSHIVSETQLEEHNPTINQEPHQFNVVPYQQQDTTTLQNVPDPSETATIQNVSELSDLFINNPQSLTITNDSNILQVPVHNITQNLINDQIKIKMTLLIKRTKTKLVTYLHQILI